MNPTSLWMNTILFLLSINFIYCTYLAIEYSDKEQASKASFALVMIIWGISVLP